MAEALRISSLSASASGMCAIRSSALLSDSVSHQDTSVASSASPALRAFIHCDVSTMIEPC
ncbi:MAG: hypothetical protein EBX60_11445 [Betaproteobacteria bacterium]|nr:hypothetical protein [Betaproteobacteria bacterium]